eukprot:CAMPEP_0206613088 /NCGR_PEP_ID=MMETSP0325_2-20121206/56455_1 /ASSEMBLY_ACC=CAM_ASM_000347 /TAXON_ID=2866 /ORGANISM="Crypthecodinium cohnii, Strain Seligo" /LENGTH=96 /DNA_ID=CAMNT_0054133061 /DNA_START=161 /DNA_END=448 /DNA_ORIENTATION=-
MVGQNSQHTGEHSRHQDRSRRVKNAAMKRLPSMTAAERETEDSPIERLHVPDAEMLLPAVGLSHHQSVPEGLEEKDSRCMTFDKSTPDIRLRPVRD